MSKSTCNVAPTRLALQSMEHRLKSAQAGHFILKNKALALNQRFREMMVEIKEQKKSLVQSMNTAAFSSTLMRYGIPYNFNSSVITAVSSPHYRIQTTTERVYGVEIPVMEPLQTKKDELVGLNQGRQRVNSCSRSYLDSLSVIVKLASLQTGFFTIDESLRVLNRRVNALEHVIIPRIEGSIAHIKEELEQQEIEEFHRLKKVKANKLRKARERVH